MDINGLPPCSLLWEHFEYAPLTGLLYWKKPRSNRLKAGDPAGNKNTNSGYYSVGLGKLYLSHRLIYKWVTGKEPAGIIEHMDDDGFNNRFWNLVDSTFRRNSTTSVILRNGKIKGCYLNPDGTYSAQIYIDGKHYTLGDFDTQGEATKAYESAVRRLEIDPLWKPINRVYLSKSMKSKTSIFKFVSKETGRKSKQWKAQYTYKNKKRSLGYFATEREAYNAAVTDRIFNSSLIDDSIEYFPSIS